MFDNTNPLVTCWILRSKCYGGTTSVADLAWWSSRLAWGGCLGQGPGRWVVLTWCIPQRTTICDRGFGQCWASPRGQPLINFGLPWNGPVASECNFWHHSVWSKRVSCASAHFEKCLGLFGSCANEESLPPCTGSDNSCTLVTFLYRWGLLYICHMNSWLIFSVTLFSGS